MSNILHFSLYSKKDKVRLAQLNTDKSKKIYGKIQGELEPIFSSSSPDKIVFDKYYISYLTKNGILYICVNKISVGSALPERFLDQSVTRLDREIDLSSISKMKDLVLQDQLGSIIDEVFENFNNGLSSHDKLEEIQQDIDETKQVMKNNIQKMIDNNDNMEELIVKSNKLKDNAEEFHETTEEIKQASKWYKRVWLYVIIIIIVLTGGYFLAAFLRCKSVNLFC